MLSFYAAAPALRRVTLTRLRNFDEVASEWNALRMPHARQLDLDTAENSFGVRLLARRPSPPTTLMPVHHSQNSLSFLSRILPSFLNITTLRLGVDFVYSFPSNLARLSRPKVPTLLVQLFEMPMPPSLQRVEVISSDELVYDKSGTEWVQLEG